MTHSTGLTVALLTALAAPMPVSAAMAMPADFALGAAAGALLAGGGVAIAWLLSRRRARRATRTDDARGSSVLDVVQPDGSLRVETLDDARSGGIHTGTTGVARSDGLHTEAPGDARSDEALRLGVLGVVDLLDVIEQMPAGTQPFELLGTVRQSARSLLDLVDGRADAPPAPQAIALADLVERTVELLDALALRDEVELMLFVDPRLPARLPGDAARLRQVLVTLIAQAIRAARGKARRGRVDVRVEAVAGDTRSTTVAITVADGGNAPTDHPGREAAQGPGEVDARHRHERPAPNHTTPGLQVVRHLARRMGGDLDVTGTAGGGTTATLRLPFDTVAPERESLPGPLTTARCLVIGEGGLAPDLAVLLAHAGAQVERAASLPAAFDALRTLPPALWIWVIDGAQSQAALDETRRALAAFHEHDVRLVVIGRGPRRQPLRVDADLVLLDGNALTRRRLAKAVALAMGLKFDAADAPDTDTPAVPSRAQAVHEGRLILVAEDDETHRNVVLRQLALLGFAADAVADGAAALARWRSGHYALLLTDLHMPELDGFELAGAIRGAESAGQRIPILALTAMPDQQDHCRAVGINACLSKPLPLAELKAVLDEWLPHAGLPRAPIDTGVLEALVGDDPDVIAGFLAAFRGSLGEIAAGIEQALERGDHAEASALAHKLKSSAHTIGATRLAGICARMEVAGKNGNAADLRTLRPQFAAEQRLAMAVLGEAVGFASEATDG